MILLCGNCNELKDFHKIRLNKTFHPYMVGDCEKCGENVFEVDELIVHSIIELNRKGWNTVYCCSGHLEEGFVATYIKFKHIPDKPPIGFYIERDCIRVNNFSQKNLVGIEGYNELVRINRNLYKWAIGLPIREGVVV